MALSINLKNDLKKISLSDPKTWFMFFSLLYIGTFLVMSLARIFYPYQLTWMEGAVVDHIRWVLAGNPLYGPPSIEFTPYIYAPFYYYFCAFFMKIFGVSFLIPRLVSLFSTLAVLFLLWRLIKYETDSTVYAFMGAGFFTALCSLTRCYFDMARVDALFIFLLFLGFYILRRSSASHAVYWSAFVFFLSIFTKQQALPVIFTVALFLLLDNFKKFVKFVSAFSLLTAAAFIFFQLTTSGWFLFYVFRLPRAHGFVKKLSLLIVRDLFLGVPVLLIFLVYLFFKIFKSKKDPVLKEKTKSDYIFYLAFFFGTLAASWASRAHAGGTENVLLPVLLSIVVVGTISFRHFEQDMKKSSPAAAGFLVLAIFLQFLLLVYNPLDYVPKKENYRFNKDFLHLIEGIEGEVLMPYIGYLPTLAGKKSHAHKTAIYDILRAKGAAFDKIKNEVNKMFRQAIRNKRFSAIIIRKDHFYLNKMKGCYKLEKRFVRPYSMYVHGYMCSRWNIYVPK